MNNINNLNKKKCCGCNTCVEICPTNAIKLVENEEGFLEYFVDENLCINCGLCVNKCPQINNIEKNNSFIPKYYAAHIKSLEDIVKSSSGGLFQIIAKEIAQKGEFAIFGAVYDDNFVVKHDFVDNIDDLEKLQGSKYVQSDVSYIYKIVKEKLEKNIKVLFVGTPCQIAGLYAYLNEKKFENLITIDLICHGVPSPLLFKKYIEFLENKYNGNLEKFNFRSKLKKLWGTNCSYQIGKKIYYKPYYLEPYYLNFIKGTIYRESCYECKYARKERIADITLGDYWGIDELHPEIYSDLGNSVVIVNTEKGEQVFNNIKEEIIFVESDFDKVSKYNHNLICPSQKPDNRNTIYKNIRNEDFGEKFSQYFNFKPSIKNIIKSKIPHFIKTSYKKIRRRFK